jgi:NADH:ubiquinone oxidoreductase subunit
MGTYMGCDTFGNRYYENRIDYIYGAHRWIEPKDIHNYDASHIPPEWHGWMTHMNDATPSMEEEYVEEQMKRLRTNEKSDAPYVSNMGYQNPIFNFHGMHNQSQIRSRGYGIGNPVVGLPPGAPDGYYTQPGSPYNDASIRKFEMAGQLDDKRVYKSEKWKERLMTAAEKEAEAQAEKARWATASATAKRLSPREQAILERGGTLAN